MGQITWKPVADPSATGFSKPTFLSILLESRVLDPKCRSLQGDFFCSENSGLADCRLGRDPIDKLAGRLVRSLIIRDAAFAVTERAVKVAEAMNELTAILRANWDEMYLDQGRGRALQAGGSLMWSSNWGWQILDRSPAQQYCGDAINLETAAKENVQIRQALDALRNAMCLSAPSTDGSYVDRV